jgi:hypothetical protein
MYSSTLSLTSALDGIVWLMPHPSHFTPGKETRYQLCRRLGGPQGQSERVWKISPPQGFTPWTVQSVASHYTHYAVPAQVKLVLLLYSWYYYCTVKYVPGNFQVFFFAFTL